MRRGGDESVVIVGAGVGGLSAAVTLAHAGCDVVVVERANAPGGKMRQAPSAAGPVDAGPTVVTLRAVFDEVFERADARLDAFVRLIPERVLARHFWSDGASLDLLDDAEESAAAIRAFAGPRAEAEYRRFAARARRLFETFEGPVLRAARPNLLRDGLIIASDPLRLLPAIKPGWSLESLLRGAFSDPRLRQLFGRYATYVGGAPHLSPGILNLVSHAEAKGVWRVEGGVHRLAQAMAALAEQRGARFRYGAGVARIETGRDGVGGVLLETGERLAADRVVFNGDPAALSGGLLGDDVRAAVRRGGVAPRSLSAYVWSFASAVSGPAPIAHHTVFFGDAPRSEFDDLVAGRMPRDPSLYVCAQDRGAGAPAPAPGGVERFEIIMNGPPVSTAVDEFSDENAEFRVCRTRTFQRLTAMGLEMTSPGPEGLTTPRRFAALHPGSDGSLYGRSPQGVFATYARPTARSRVPRLYLAGGGAHPGPGAPMAALSGLRAAEAILSDRASTSTSRLTATRGGMSTPSPTTAAAASRSSAS